MTRCSAKRLKSLFWLSPARKVSGKEVLNRSKFALDFSAKSESVNDWYTIDLLIAFNKITKRGIECQRPRVIEPLTGRLDAFFRFCCAAACFGRILNVYGTILTLLHDFAFRSRKDFSIQRFVRPMCRIPCPSVQSAGRLNCMGVRNFDRLGQGTVQKLLDRSTRNAGKIKGEVWRGCYSWITPSLIVALLILFIPQFLQLWLTVKFVSGKNVRQFLSFIVADVSHKPRFWFSR